MTSVHTTCIDDLAYHNLSSTRPKRKRTQEIEPMVLCAYGYYLLIGKSTKNMFWGPALWYNGLSFRPQSCHLTWALIWAQAASLLIQLSTNVPGKAKQKVALVPVLLHPHETQEKLLAPGLDLTWPSHYGHLGSQSDDGRSHSLILLLSLPNSDFQINKSLKRKSRCHYHSIKILQIDLKAWTILYLNTTSPFIIVNISIFFIKWF